MIDCVTEIKGKNTKTCRTLFAFAIALLAIRFLNENNQTSTRAVRNVDKVYPISTLLDKPLFCNITDQNELPDYEDQIVLNTELRVGSIRLKSTLTLIRDLINRNVTRVESKINFTLPNSDDEYVLVTNFLIRTKN